MSSISSSFPNQKRPIAVTVSFTTTRRPSPIPVLSTFHMRCRSLPITRSLSCIHLTVSDCHVRIKLFPHQLRSSRLHSLLHGAMALPPRFRPSVQQKGLEHCPSEAELTQPTRPRDDRDHVLSWDSSLLREQTAKPRHSCHFHHAFPHARHGHVAQPYLFPPSSSQPISSPS